MHAKLILSDVHASNRPLEFQTVLSCACHS